MINRLKEKWTKFYQPEQNWDIDICITKTTRKHLVHRIVDLYINKALELNQQNLAEKMYNFYYDDIQDYSCNILDFDYLNELTMYKINSVEDLNILGDILYTILNKIGSSPRRNEKEEVFTFSNVPLPENHISYPHDWTNNICKCLYKSDNLCPYAKECKGIPRKGCQYEKEMVMDLDYYLNQLKERGII